MMPVLARRGVAWLAMPDLAWRGGERKGKGGVWLDRVRWGVAVRCAVLRWNAQSTLH